MNKSVLVVEDEIGVRRALGRMLGARGFRMIEAGNGREAIQRLTEETPAAIVIDLLMPVMSGAELLKALRRNAFYRRIPTVVMTGAFESEMPGASEIMGVPVVFKPNLESLPAILADLMARQEKVSVPKSERSGSSALATAESAMATEADSVG